jgi:hypothetical protein
VACSMTVSMYIRAPVTVTVSTKSHASRASALERRKSAQVVVDRCGARVPPPREGDHATVVAMYVTGDRRRSSERRR